MPPTALDKKANFECLERDVGLAKFLPNVRYQINYMITIPYEDAIKRILSLRKNQCYFLYLYILFSTSLIYI